MGGDIEHGTCSVCKAEGPINRKYYHYDLLCQCHMPKHFEMVYHCNNCEPVEPDTTKITIDTTILKTYTDANYSQKEVEELLWEARKFYNGYATTPYARVRGPFKRWAAELFKLKEDEQ